MYLDHFLNLEIIKRIGCPVMVDPFRAPIFLIFSRQRNFL